jgi:PhzF family phenazine biosynthesis protein
MQNVAMEMNCSETAFLVPRADGYDLRWFTPVTEVALCGHATLASAHILWETGRLAVGAEARFHTKSGLLTCTRMEDGRIELNFPATLVTPVVPPPELVSALGIRPEYAGINAFDYLIEVGSDDMVRTLTPDFQALRTIPVRGVIVTSRSSDPVYDFVSRFFAPGAGIDEDPVTGSAHCALGPYWAARMGKNTFTAFQASRRGGILGIRVVNNRVFLAGRAMTMLRGDLA